MVIEAAFFKASVKMKSFFEGTSSAASSVRDSMTISWNLAQLATW